MSNDIADASMSARSLTAGGGTVTPAILGVPATSQFKAPPGWDAMPFELRLGIETLSILMDVAYANFIAEISADDERYGDPVQELANASYPATIRALLDFPTALDAVFGSYLTTELLDKLNASRQMAPTVFFLTPHRDQNACHCVREGEEIVVTGMCATKRP